MDHFLNTLRYTSVSTANLIGSSHKDVKFRKSSERILRQGNTRNTNRRAKSKMKSPKRMKKELESKGKRQS